MSRQEREDREDRWREDMLGATRRSMIALETIAETMVESMDRPVEPDAIREPTAEPAPPSSGFLRDPLIVDLVDAARVVARSYYSGVGPSEEQSAFATQAITRWAIAAGEMVPHDVDQDAIGSEPYDLIPGDAGVVEAPVETEGGEQ